MSKIVKGKNYFKEIRKQVTKCSVKPINDQN